MSVKNGVVLRLLPPGFRFRPTDEELVVEYLLRKVLSLSFSFIIPVLHHVCDYDPSHLPPGGDGGQERYFFSEAKYYPNGNSRSNSRATTASGGYWKATGIDKQVVASKSNQIVGMKKTLIYYRGKARTDWVMHQYRLTLTLTTSNNKAQNWVLCRIFLKKRRKNNNNNRNELESCCIKQPVMLYDLNLVPTTSSTTGGIQV